MEVGGKRPVGYLIHRLPAQLEVAVDFQECACVFVIVCRLLFFFFSFLFFFLAR